MTILRNLDVDPPVDVCSAYPDIRHIVCFQPLIERFHELDAKAQFWKRLYVATGATAVLLGLAAIEFQVFTLMSLPRAQPVPPWLALIFSGMGVVALLLVLISHAVQFRDRWLRNLFSREMLRLWRHQIVLDGEFIDLVLTDRERHDAILKQRWSEIEYQSQISDGALRAFVDSSSPRTLLFGGESPRDARLRQQVLDAQKTLRLDYQLGFARIRTSTGLRVARMFEVGSVTEWIATTALVLAVGTTVAEFFLSIGIGEAPILLAAAGLGLAVLSASVRALRSGLTIPDEKASFGEYSSTLHLIDDTYRSVLEDGQRWELMRRLEAAATHELYRFLHAKEGSRFLV